MCPITSAHRRLRAMLTVAIALGVLGVLSTGSGAAGQTGALAGTVTAPSVNGTPVRVAGAVVTATASSGTSYTTSTTADGHYELDQLPAPGSYAVSVSPAAGATADGHATVSLRAGSLAVTSVALSQRVVSVVGEVSGRLGALPGMPVVLTPAGASCPQQSSCGPTATTDDAGHFTLNVAPGTYTFGVSDAGRTVDQQTVTPSLEAPTAIDPSLGPAPVPTGTLARHAERDLRWLNAQRVRAGLPGGVVLNSRWSQDCAAHDIYEHDNGVLSHSEDPAAPGASVGGAWAGLTSVLAQARWTPRASPWQNAPIHLMQLLSPSLSVVGLDDSDGLQCATTYPGLVRAPSGLDAVSTYPGNGVGDVPVRERAREAPFVPGQFVGLGAGRTTGRELFVYLNQSGQTGQAQVRVRHATLTRAGAAVAVRWVDNSTPTIGAYLTGAILIPVTPLRADTRYRATVVLQDRSSTITHRWSFTTGRG